MHIAIHPIIDYSIENQTTTEQKRKKKKKKKKLFATEFSPHIMDMQSVQIIKHIDAITCTRSRLGLSFSSGSLSLIEHSPPRPS